MSTVLDVVKPENVDLQALLKEVGDEVETLIKNEQSKLEAMKKENMEKPAAEMKKDEGSGFENPAPEASSQPAPSGPPASPEESQEQSKAESLEDMVRSLDEDMLQELMQVVQMEMESRKQSSAPAAPEASMSPPPAAQPPAPEQKMEMAYKKEFDGMKEKLAKSEEQAKNLEKAFTSMTDLLDKMVNRPVTKAVTDIRAVDYVDKGEKELKKNEDIVNISDTDLKKHLFKMSSNPKELAKLTKGERDTLSEYFTNKKRTPEVLKLISK